MAKRNSVLSDKNLIVLCYLFFYVFLSYFLLVHFDELYPYPIVLNRFDLGNSLIGLILILMLSVPVAYSKQNSVLATLCHMFSLLMVIPSISLFTTTGLALFYPILYIVFIYLFLYVGSLCFRVPMFSLSQNNKNTIVILLALFSLIYFFAIHGFKVDLNALLLESIYDIRDEAAESRNQFSRYLYSWASKIFLPLLLIYGIGRKKGWVISLGIFGMIYLFLTSAHKSVLFSTVVLLIFSGQGTFELKNKKFIYSFLSLLVISHVTYLVAKVDLLQSLFIRRLLILPAILNEYYTQTFTDNYMRYSHSFLSGLSNDFGNTPPYVVGVRFFGTDMISANNGFASDGFANLGYTGAFLHMIILFVALSLLGRFKISARYYGFLFIFVYQFNTSALFTTFLHHGFFLLFLMAGTGFLADGIDPER